MSHSAYSDLTDVAERMKLREMSAFARLHRRDAALSVKITDLAVTLARESAAAAPGDMTAALSLQRYASVAARQADLLLAEKRALAKDLETARQSAIRANGRTQAIEILIAKERQAETLRRQRQEERSMTFLSK